MTRLRKASRLRRSPALKDLAASVMVGCDAAVFEVEPERIFARRAPLEVELGAGKGEFIVEWAAARPERDFLAVELSGAVAQLLALRCAREKLSNLRVARMDARTLVNLMLRDASVAAYHIYFPDPWPKERHVKHRMFSPRFAQNLVRTLEAGGSLHVATDVRAYADAILPMLETAGLVRVAEDSPGAHATGFARKYLAAGKRVLSASFSKPR
ncbi:MAG: tRNA (guanine(46)-N(7))-methyltransferase TrmB [Candidatus Binataceae bacterium]